MKPRVLVTGGAQGIGAAIATRCRSEGHEVIILDRGTADDTIAVDLFDPQATADALALALADGPITRLVNNVGAVFPAAVDEQSPQEYSRAHRLNLAVAAQCMQALLPGMREQGFGRVVNLSSRAALGKELRSAYAATKAGLIGLTRTWALELGPLGVTVNAIGPGPIGTELFARANPQGSPRTKRIIEQIPVGRIGTPEDVAEAAAYFLSDGSGFVTGQVLYVCGGLTIGTVGI